MKLVYCIFCLFILFSCSNKDYNYVLINSKDTNNSYKVITKDNGNKLSIFSLYKEKMGGTEFYFLRKNGEFYSCDKSFSKKSIGKQVLLSTIKEYEIYDGDKYKGDSLVIKKVRNNYTTLYKSINYGVILKIEYSYDKNYRIDKITFNNIAYSKH